MAYIIAQKNLVQDNKAYGPFEKRRDAEDWADEVGMHKPYEIMSFHGPDTVKKKD